MLLYEQARALAEFCVRHGGKCFASWAVPLVFQYCFFHLATRTAFVARAGGRGSASPGITAAMFVWGAPEAEIRAREAAGSSAFYWQRSKDKADSLFLAEVIKLPDKNAIVIAKLFRQAASRWPDWDQKKIFTYRNGFLVELEPAAIAKLLQPKFALPT